MTPSERELHDKVKKLAEECKASPERHSRAAAIVLYTLVASLLCNREEEFCNIAADFAESIANSISANRN